METLKLPVEVREATGRRAKTVRAEAKVPAVIYGHNFKNQNISVPYNLFEKVHKEGGESSLIDLEVEGGDSTKVVIKDVQRHPLTDRYTHVDFYKVNLKKKIQVEVSLNFIGESPAVKEQGGSLVKGKDTIEVECLPTALVNEIDVDVSILKTFEDMIRVSDIQLPEGVEVLDDPENSIVSVNAPISEEEIKAEEEAEAAEDAAGVADIKTEGEEKKEEKEAEEAAEGGDEEKKEEEKEEKPAE